MATPFDQRPDLIWFDGKLVPTVDCKISVLTHGLHYASAVFEGERAYGGEIFKSTAQANSQFYGQIRQIPGYPSLLLNWPVSYKKQVRIGLFDVIDDGWVVGILAGIESF